MPLCTCTLSRLRPCSSILKSHPYRPGRRRRFHRYAGQLAVQTVAPLVIRADKKTFALPNSFWQNFAPLLRATVLHDVHHAVAIAHHNHQPFTDQRRLVITSVRYLAFERDASPVVTMKGLHLALVKRGVAMNTVGICCGVQPVNNEIGGISRSWRRQATSGRRP